MEIAVLVKRGGENKKSGATDRQDAPCIKIEPYC